MWSVLFGAARANWKTILLGLSVAAVAALVWYAQRITDQRDQARADVKTVQSINQLNELAYQAKEKRLQASLNQALAAVEAERARRATLYGPIREEINNAPAADDGLTAPVLLDALNRLRRGRAGNTEPGG
ncbi:MAG: hypothetical protein AAF556_04775 [Pseudomonadota bacterium]